jgi:putative Ca2+/H+ antiporter (TMEM165/GDT1 family)
VWFLTISNGFGHGVLPLAWLIWAIVSAKSELPMFQTLLTAGVLIAIVASSIGTWAGENFFRRMLLVALGVQFVTFLIYTFEGSDLEKLSRSDALHIAGITVRSFVWLAVNVWYFTRPKVLAFYL